MVRVRGQQQPSWWAMCVCVRRFEMQIQVAMEWARLVRNFNGPRDLPRSESLRIKMGMDGVYIMPNSDCTVFLLSKSGLSCYQGGPDASYASFRPWGHRSRDLHSCRNISERIPCKCKLFDDHGCMYYAKACKGELTPSRCHEWWTVCTCSSPTCSSFMPFCIGLAFCQEKVASAGWTLWSKSATKFVWQGIRLMLLLSLKLVGSSSNVWLMPPKEGKYCWMPAITSDLTKNKQRRSFLYSSRWRESNATHGWVPLLASIELSMLSQ